MDTSASLAKIVREAEALFRAGRYAEAAAGFEQALSLKPGNGALHANSAAAALKLGRPQAALESAEAALALNPRILEARVIRGEALLSLGRHQEAAGTFEEVLAEAPSNVAALAGRGEALLSLRHFSAAVASYDAALALKPKLGTIPGQRLYAKMNICAWDDFDAEVAAMTRGIEDGRIPSPPFPTLAALDSPRLQRTLTERFAGNSFPVRDALGALPERRPGQKIRLGYFSADFHDHPVSRLMAGVFESHDRGAFEVTAFSFGPPVEDAMRGRLKKAFSHFFDVRGLTDLEIAEHARRAEIDIAVDLTGYTTNCRPAIFSFRTAPIQASYIGYLGTMAAPYYDYLLADHALIPNTARQHYAEKIVYLPSYQANDSRRVVAEHHYTRSELGLPESGFVFCCFNNSYKITPHTFAGWMRILDRATDSTLLLFAANAEAAANLKKETARHGVDPRRVVLCETLPGPQYMARLRAADLFLDTLPYNAGTTASDALWAGLPVLTRAGESFAGRMASSLLRALDLPELAAQSQEDYEARAVALAANPVEMSRIREKLRERRTASALFDTVTFTRKLESAFTEMANRVRSGQPPADIVVT